MKDQALPPSSFTHHPSAREAGSSLAWTAIFFAAVLVPLMIFVVDGARILRVRSRLQTAVDAACEDAAWSAADVDHYRETGETRFKQNWYIFSIAHTTFQNVLNDQGISQYYPALRVFPDNTHALVACDAQAHVPLLIGSGAASIETESVSQIRFSR